ncbi:MAG: FlgO family outer membrane protein [Elusimicrobia bacterium]|nr:FlgO family outer membrane protein [Elusimicrobiota bacterium]
MLKTRLFAGVFLTALLAAGLGDLRAAELDKLSDKLQDGLKDKTGIKVAVLEFQYTDAKASKGPVIIQERLTTALAQNKKITLIERNLLKKVMGELSLEVSGAISEESVKKIGRILGADAVVTGTLNDLSEVETEINARIVETESGKILSAAAATVKKTWKEQGGTTAHGTGGDFSKKPLVQVAVLLDTSNSMDGLINQARTQLWKIVNELISSEKNGSGPAIEVALYEYGNSGLSRESGYIRQVSPFTKDLDQVSQELFALKTNGGDEYCGWVLKDAVEKLSWSSKNDVYKTIFIAGNEPFTQGPVDFAAAAAEAKAKGIFVNTIFCGSRQAGIATQWLAGAQAADGDYSNIDQSAVVYTVSAPQDNTINELSVLLNQTYVTYGAEGEASMKRKKEVDSNMAAAGASVMSERAAFKAAAPGAARQESSWDVVSAVESGAVRKDEIKADQLPPELQKMKKEELGKYIDTKLAERKKIKSDITRLQEERKKYLAAEEAKHASGPNTLDKAVIDSIRKQATKRGFTFK